MIYFYSGTPGSGKSYHVAREIKLKLTTGKNVISTVDINTNVISKNGKRRIADFKYIPIMEINPVILYEYAYRNHKKGKEGQTLVIIDECQILFNPREFQKKDRIDWINFFTQHRHLGYNFILISQFDRLVDRQIRSLFEYEVKHRKINNYKLMVLLPFTIFAAVTVWYGIKEKMSSSFIIYNKKLARMYDSYTMFDRLIGENVKESDGAEIVLDITEEPAEAPAIAKTGGRGAPSKRKRRSPALIARPRLMMGKRPKKEKRKRDWGYLTT